MKLIHQVWATALALVTASPLIAQQGEPAAATRCAPEAALPPIVKSMLCTISDAYHRPLHPMVREIAPGGGLGAGLEFTRRARSLWQARAAGTVTVRGSWSGELGAGYHGGHTGAEIYGRVRDLPRLDFFGPDITGLIAHANYRLREAVVGAIATLRPVSWLTVGGRVEGLWPEVRSGRSSSLPSIEDRFDEAEAPGVTVQPAFIRYEAALDLRIPAGLGEALYQGARYRIAYTIYSDREIDRFSFRRIELEAQQRFALLVPLSRLTLHGWPSLTDADAGHTVPFYLQHTLGGKWNLRSVHEDLIGSDGTQATLRGFRNFQFRDRNVLLLQAEYRIPVWGPLDATVFADAGKVTPRREDLDLSALKHNVGFSLSVMRGPATAARVDFGVGKEGMRVFLTLRREAIP